MDQVHTRFSDEQVVFLLEAYSQGLMTSVGLQEVLRVGESRFFALRREYRSGPEAFTISYQRTSPRRILSETEAAVESELRCEEALIDDPDGTTSASTPEGARPAQVRHSHGGPRRAANREGICDPPNQRSIIAQSSEKRTPRNVEEGKSPVAGDRSDHRAALGPVLSRRAALEHHARVDR